MIKKKSIGEIIPQFDKYYAEFVKEIKRTIQESRIRVSYNVNRELIKMYWQIGKEIVKRQKVHGWGKSIVERLSRDLQKEFPGVNGFSSQNLWYM